MWRPEKLCAAGEREGSWPLCSGAGSLQRASPPGPRCTARQPGVCSQSISSGQQRQPLLPPTSVRSRKVPESRPRQADRQTDRDQRTNLGQSRNEDAGLRAKFGDKLNDLVLSGRAASDKLSRGAPSYQGSSQRRPPETEETPGPWPGRPCRVLSAGLAELVAPSAELKQCAPDAPAAGEDAGTRRSRRLDVLKNKALY